MPKSSKRIISIPDLKLSGANPILVTLLVVAAFLIGSMYTKISYLEKGTGTTPTVAQAPNQPNQPATPAPGQKVNVSSGHFPALGNKNAKVTIVEFADFRCPFCEQFFTQTEPSIIKDYVDTGKASFYFRHFAFLGAASVVAANAAECANEQGKFWDFHNYLYKNQPPETDTSMYNTDTLTTAAGTLGMNTDQFKSCLSANKDQKNVDSDLADGQKAGVNGTPTIFINGTPIVGAVPYTQIKSSIDAELAK